MSTEPNKVIYSMVGVSKYYDKKAVLKDIYLSYFYGSKIGVIGLKGSVKSKTILLTYALLFISLTSTCSRSATTQEKAVGRKQTAGKAKNCKTRSYETRSSR